jgi:peptide/nickel transport system permease protein
MATRWPATSIMSHPNGGYQKAGPPWECEEGRVYWRRAPGSAMAPGLAIMATVLGSNLMEDGLRDEPDPRLRGT